MRDTAGQSDQPLRLAHSDALTEQTAKEPRRTIEGSTATLRRRLSGDLDNIILMALRKERSRRYASVEQFAEDIRRHLDGLPVSATKGSWSYRARKFVGRHKLGMAATVIVLLAVAAGVATTLREARIAAAHQRRAEQRFNDVRKLANSLMFEIHDAIRDLPGSTPARKLLVTRAVEYLDSLSAQSKGDVSLQKELAAAYERVGDVLGYPYAANLGDKPGAMQSYGKALAIRESLAAAAPADIMLQRDLVGTYFRLAQILEASGNFTDALASLAKAQPITERLAAGSNDPVLADHYAGGYYFTASIQVRTGDLVAALENYRHAAAIRSAALQVAPGNLSLRVHLAADYGGIAQCLDRKHDFPHSIEIQSKATGILADVAKSNPDSATLSEYLGEATNRLATYRDENGDHVAAFDSYRQAHKIFADLLAADPKNSLAKSNFGFSNIGIAHCLLLLGKPAAAVKIFRESISTFEEMSPSTSGNRYIRTGLASAYSNLADAYSALASAAHTSPSQMSDYWQKAHSACQKSLAVWNDKEKRGELESDERALPQQVAQCVATTEAKLRNPLPKQSNLH